MEKELETCIACGIGKMRPNGRTSVNEKGSTKEYEFECDNCGTKRIY